MLKFVNKSSNSNIDDFIKLSIKLYEKGYSGVDIINLLETQKFILEI